MVCLNRGTQFFHFINQHGPCPQHCFFKKNRYNKVEFTYIYYFELDKREIYGIYLRNTFYIFSKKNISIITRNNSSSTINPPIRGQRYEDLPEFKKIFRCQKRIELEIIIFTI